MSKLLIKIILVGVTLSFACQLPHPTPPVIVKDLPNRVGYVNDFAEILKKDTRENLETKLAEFKQNYDVEFVIVTVNSNGNRTPLEYSDFIKERWKLKPKRDDDKIILINFSKVPQDFNVSITDELLSTITPKQLEDLADLLSEETKNQTLDKSLSLFVDTLISTITDSANKQKNS